MLCRVGLSGLCARMRHMDAQPITDTSHGLLAQAGAPTGAAAATASAKQTATGTASGTGTGTQAHVSARTRGQIGEDIAAEYLVGLGYKVVERNWHCRFGELDIIATSPEGILVFVEVKYRDSDFAGGGVAAVTHKKLDRMCNAAVLWLRTYPKRAPFDLRFDVIDVGPSGVREHVEAVR